MSDNTIQARHLGKAVIAIIRMLMGGEILQYTKRIAEVGEHALNRMIVDAEGLGADAVVNVRFSKTVGH